MDLKPAVDYYKIPFVAKNKISKWPLRNFDKSDWCNIFHNKELEFRKGYHGYSRYPTWEGNCDTVKMTLSDFFNVSELETSKWLYFDYKYLTSVCIEGDDLAKSLSWSELGFSEITWKQSTIWIGNAGAHTPCHQDTYGCNLVAQLYGRKLWILIPPSETPNMYASRVPYEESSVYSELNFFTPCSKITNLKNSYKVILEPGDVLFVPRHWWHYVENLEVAISVNAWIPAEEDKESRLGEAMVQRLVWNFCQDLTLEEAKLILNPNETSMLTTEMSDSLLSEVISQCKSTVEKSENNQTMPEPNIDDIIPLEPMKPGEMNQYLLEKTEQHRYDPSVNEAMMNTPLSKITTTKLLINSFCNPEAISIAREKLLKQLTALD